MNLSDYSRNSILPLKSLHWLKTKGLIHEPLEEIELLYLKFLEKIWGRQSFILPQLATFSRSRRNHLLKTSRFASRWERYAYSRYTNLIEGKRLSLEHLIQEIEITFGFSLKGIHVQQLKKVRQIAYNERRKNHSSSSENYDE